jgi:hypothetical protein
MIDVSGMDDLVYDFLNGVLPTLIDIDNKTLGWDIRFEGYVQQDNPLLIDVLKRYNCWIKMQSCRATYRWPTDFDGNVKQEMEYTYSISLECKQTNALDSTALTYATRLIAHREGYTLFDEAGISEFKITDVGSRVENNVMIYTADMILRCRGLVLVDRVTVSDKINSGTVKIYKQIGLPGTEDVINQVDEVGEIIIDD